MRSTDLSRSSTALDRSRDQAARPGVFLVEAVRLSGRSSRVQPLAVTFRWFTDVDRAEQARFARERRERDEVLHAFAQWLSDRSEHDGPVTVPELTPESEARLLRLLREGS
jgi:hypothetical protein